MEKQLPQLFKELNKNTMFHLSLGSKELFHSNFLEFLWNQSPIDFLKMLLELLQSAGREIFKSKFSIAFEESINCGKDEIEEKIYNTFTLAREEKDFDICIYHENTGPRGGKKRVYDLIIENKVKSIPYKEQLDRYEKKVQDNQGETEKPIYILLSLATVFPEKNEIIWQKNWNIVSYQQLHDAIQKVYGEENTYIRDYLSFIENLHSLKDEILKADFKDLPYYNPEEMKPFADIRLHDMYVKLRGSYFVCLLKEALLAKKHPAVYIEFFPGNREKPKEEAKSFKKYDTIIWLKSEMTNAKQSTITISIKLRDSKNSYDIQIEGDDYRHMFSHTNLVEKRDEEDKRIKEGICSQNWIETCLNNMDYFNIGMLPSELSKNEWDGKTSKGYNQFKPDILHKYVKIPKNIKVNSMIEIIVKDIDNILDYINECEKQAESLTF